MSAILGKVIVQGVLVAETGLRVGGGSGGLKIGGVDLNVITDPLGRPYIPGSSLKGKSRSLMERFHQLPVTYNGMHLCREEADYAQCLVCRVWGVLGDARNFSSPTLTRLIVRDAPLDESSITEEMRRNMELRWTEVKMETAINRVTGAAQHGSLRQIERVPAGARFKDCQFIFTVLQEEDKHLLKQLFISMELLENDYLGGMGSRGSGRVRFSDLAVYWNSKASYESGEVSLTTDRKINADADTPAMLVQRFDEILKGMDG
ncbi:MAG: type III-A CRISPR-associated RAMP protein Csm3 [Desulfobacterales bacterium]|nr:type III-A CRISPR-associated RAMP protein Csm3 [Desulfobacterales bacterium]